MFIASSLAHINSPEINQAIEKASNALSKIIGENGIIPGFPQSNWFATKYWSVLSDLADKINDPGSLASIAENLIESGVSTADPLIQKCRRKILRTADTMNIEGTIYQGWSDTSNNLDTAITLRCLIVLRDHEDHYLSKYKISNTIT
jgi:hypothetical protein